MSLPILCLGKLIFIKRISFLIYIYELHKEYFMHKSHKSGVIVTLHCKLKWIII